MLRFPLGQAAEALRREPGSSVRARREEVGVQAIAVAAVARSHYRHLEWISTSGKNKRSYFVVDTRRDPLSLEIGFTHPPQVLISWRE